MTHRLTHAHILPRPERRPKMLQAHCPGCIAVRGYVLGVTAERWAAA